MSFAKKGGIEVGLFLVGVLFIFMFVQCSNKNVENVKPRILIGSDMGGTDPDDNLSMILLLMYADLFNIEGLVESPYGEGRKKGNLDMIDLHEKDLSQMRNQSSGPGKLDELRSVCKQGAIHASPFKGYDAPSEGSDWIIQFAEKPGEQPLWVLVWGGLEDVAQALHDTPGIKEKMKVYWIGQKDGIG